ncbi:Coenzyme F420 hydrogenase/dehydrogenase, beta subunit C-terminal domain [Geofilum sp. OHC36d9]|uniref:Coenzyme F420 hydrogenase/dehydrogenase, beta subunit C-terminal domain n=1 Tax=Geofilum sp. OHC36d9 TaxID=3458413 RepID=UPI004034139B
MKLNVETAYKQKLCSSCGFCVGVCPHQSIRYDVDNHGFFKPVIDKNTCTDCGLCYELCPGVTDLKDYSSKEEVFNYGYSNDESIRLNSASGGVVTELLCFLLDQNIVDFVSVVSNRMKHDKPRCFFTNDSDVVRDCKTSKYCPVPVGEILGPLKQIKGTVAVLGLPCQINALKAYAGKRASAQRKIKFYFALLCNHTPSYTATDFLSANLKFPDWDSVLYRGNGWPGEMMFSNDQKKEKLFTPYRKTWATGYGLYFKNRRCFICNDPFGKSADIVFGDAYFLQNETKGATFCISRNKEISGLLSDMKEKKRIQLLDGPNPDTVAKFFKILFDREVQYPHKLSMMKRLGLPVPEHKGKTRGSFSFKNLMGFVKSLIIIELGRCKLLWPFLFRRRNGEQLPIRIEKY